MEKSSVNVINRPEQLDPITLPLTGQALIEASAGTGKTYTLAALYLRLLLGLGRESPLEVERILVVTFTEAATQELRERIRSRIQEARIAFVLGHSEDPFIAALLSLHQNHQRAILDLEFAASEMDQAAVYTIHGFCQRMLKQHAFESAASFNAELIQDDSAIVRRALLDYWRSELYSAPSDLADEILQCYSTPDKLFSQLRSYIGLADMLLEPDYSAFDLLPNWQAFCLLQDQLRQALLVVVESQEPEDDLLALIQGSSVDKRSYSKRNLPVWYAKLVAFAAGDAAPFEVLEKFSQAQLEEKAKTNDVPKHLVFEKIAAFCYQKIDFKAVIFCRALVAVRKNMQAEKQKHQQLSFDDLLHKLSTALDSDSGSDLIAAIRKQYPFALIDEFQDTDPAQYRIFSKLYTQTDPESVDLDTAESLGLLMIGDPKQSIYAFRGADVFTYMHARRQVTKHYTLGTNWRSSKAMISAINHLFARSPAAFIYQQDIPFYSVASSGKAGSLTMSGKPVTALNFWYSDNELNNEQYLIESAAIGAAQIEKLMLQAEIKQQPLNASNIAVLVRDRKEAALIQKALTQLRVDSVFMSNRENVYSVNIAKELVYLLKAVNEPSNERFMRTALATEILQLDARELFLLNQDEIAWEMLVTEFTDYRKIWWRSGVLAMLHRMLQQRCLAQRWLSENEGERRLTDFLHLAELLQQASVELESNEALIRFLQDKRAQPEGQVQDQQLRLDSDRSRVTVITIHKSKGLEYDVVFIPFASRYRKSSNKLFHREDGQTVLDLSGKDNRDDIQKEQLAEDLRLLYVAITRSVHACFIGMGNINLRNKSVWHQTAIGYLLTLINGTDSNEQLNLAGDIGLSQALELLAVDNPEISIINTAHMGLSQGDLFAVNETKEDVPSKNLEARLFIREINFEWRVTSYSALSKDAQHSVVPDTSNNALLGESKLDLEVIDEVDSIVAQVGEKTIFSFAKGAVAGTFLHSVYEDIDFSVNDSDQIQQVLEQRLALTGYDADWLICLRDFVYQSLRVELDPNNPHKQFSLSSITPGNRLVEMEFVLPFKTITQSKINSLLRQFDPLAQRAGNLVFAKVAGMLKGFIDLTLRVGEEYYVVDYKSNYLGAELEDYHLQKMQIAMIEHRYDFQYVLYTLALHRLLRTRLVDYNYDKHVGGVFYLFLRGMVVGSNTGVFFTKPDRQLIEALDQLFEGAL